MPGTGPVGKPAATRARRNKNSTNAVLTQLSREDQEALFRPLPRGVNWHPMTTAWWRDIWASPMAPEFDKSDIHGLYALAVIVNDFWLADNPTNRQKASTEIRLLSQRYGLSPMDRRRLQWEIEKTGEAQARGQKRRRREAEGEGQPAPSPAPAGVDPRTVLRSA
jgi:hypothetical protein